MVKPPQSHMQAAPVRVAQPVDNPEVDIPYEPDQKKVTSTNYHSSREMEEEEDKHEDHEPTEDQQAQR